MVQYICDASEWCSIMDGWMPPRRAMLHHLYAIYVAARLREDHNATMSKMSLAANVSLRPPPAIRPCRIYPDYNSACFRSFAAVIRQRPYTTTVNKCIY